MQPEARASAPVALFGGDWEHSVTMPLGGTRLRDLRAVFPAMPERVGADGVRALVSLQRTGHDLVARGPGPAAAARRWRRWPGKAEPRRRRRT